LVSRARLTVLAVLLVPVIVIAAVALIYDSTQIASSPGAHFSGFTVGGKTFEFTSVATTQAELSKGLMGAKVTSSTFELFVFPSPGTYSFWMSGVNSSLDIMWLSTPQGSDTGSFVYLAPDSAPCDLGVLCPTFNPTAKADYVIEAQGGFAAANGIQVGTPVTLH
jgi:uncharacterized membrane protein (UPF0127 family)